MMISCPVVLDVGTYLSKCGLSGDANPQTVEPTLVGKTKFSQVMLTRNMTACYGLEAKRKRGMMTLKYPLSRGQIENFVDFEEYLDYLFKFLFRNSHNNKPAACLMTETPKNSKNNRQTLLELLFERFQFNYVNMAYQAVLALYSTGRSTGVVLNTGEGTSHVIPVYDGYMLSEGVGRIDVAGKDVTDYLKLLLNDKGKAFKTSQEMDIVRDIKQNTCYVSPNMNSCDRPNPHLSLPSESSPNYLLPDGQELILGKERSMCYELLFQPHIIGKESVGVHQMLHSGIKHCELDIRRHLYANIVLAGGSTVPPGFPQRLGHEIKHLAPHSNNVNIVAIPDRICSTWIGGSILASLSTCRWLHRNQYHDLGASKAANLFL